MSSFEIIFLCVVLIYFGVSKLKSFNFGVGVNVEFTDKKLSETKTIFPLKDRR